MYLVFHHIIVGSIVSDDGFGELNMQLKSLHLKNIKNHTNLSVSFTEGITAILGKNGAGKTTIFESIGLVLFNHLLYSQKQFISHGKTWGQIELELYHELTGKTVTIVRRIGNNPKYELTIEGSTISGKIDVQDWIYKNLNINKDMELSKLFSEIIAIPQGLATAHFLLPPRQREEIFNSILGVDTYRDCYEKLRPVEGLCKKEITEYELEIGKLKIHLEDYNKEVEKLDSLIDEGEKMKEEVSKITETFIKAEVELKKLDEMENLVNQKEYLEGQNKQLKSEIDGTKDKINELKVDEKRKEEIEKELLTQSDKEREHCDVTNRFTDVLYEIKELDKDINDYESEIKDFNNDMKDYDEIAKNALQFNNIKKYIDELKANISVWDNELENLKLGERGVCPILEENCDRICSDAYRRKVQSLRLNLEEARSTLVRLQDNEFPIVSRAKQIKDRLDEKLEHMKEIKILLMKDKKVVSEKKKEYSLLREELTRLQEELKVLDELSEEYNEIRLKEERVEAYRETLDDYTTQLRINTEDLRKISDKTLGYDSDTHSNAQERVLDLRDVLSRTKEKSSQNTLERASQENYVNELNEKKEFLKEYSESLLKSSQTLEKIKKIREIFKNIGSDLTGQYLNNISYSANQMWQELKSDDRELTWQNDYNIKVGDEDFIQLSGGEQMLGAIAVRIALLQYSAPEIKLIILDEPTANIDKDNRESLAEAIRELQGYSQILVVSHDSCFESITDNVKVLGD